MLDLLKTKSLHTSVLSAALFYIFANPSTFKMLKKVPGLKFIMKGASQITQSGVVVNALLFGIVLFLCVYLINHSVLRSYLNVVEHASSTVDQDVNKLMKEATALRKGKSEKCGGKLCWMAAAVAKYKEGRALDPEYADAAFAAAEQIAFLEEQTGYANQEAALKTTLNLAAEKKEAAQVKDEKGAQVDLLVSEAKKDEVGRNYAQAVDNYKKALDLEPRDVAALRRALKADITRAQGEAAEKKKAAAAPDEKAGEDAMKRANSTGTSDSVAAKDYAQAVDDYTKALDLNPGEKGGGLWWAKAGEKKVAAEEKKAAVARLVKAANADMKRQDYADAADKYGQAHKLNKSLVFAQDKLLAEQLAPLVKEGKAAMKRRDFTDAAEKYAYAHRLSGAPVIAKELKTARQQERQQQQQQDLERQLDAIPDGGPEILKKFGKASQKDKTNEAEFLMIDGKELMKYGEYAAAVNKYKLAHALDPSLWYFASPLADDEQAATTAAASVKNDASEKESKARAKIANAKKAEKARKTRMATASQMWEKNNCVHVRGQDVVRTAVLDGWVPHWKDCIELEHDIIASQFGKSTADLDKGIHRWITPDGNLVDQAATEEEHAYYKIHEKDIASAQTDKKAQIKKILDNNVFGAKKWSKQLALDVVDARSVRGAWANKRCFQHHDEEVRRADALANEAGLPDSDAVLPTPHSQETTADCTKLKKALIQIQIGKSSADFEGGAQRWITPDGNLVDKAATEEEQAYYKIPDKEIARAQTDKTAQIKKILNTKLADNCWTPEVPCSHAQGHANGMYWNTTQDSALKDDWIEFEDSLPGGWGGDRQGWTDLHAAHGHVYGSDKPDSLNQWQINTGQAGWHGDAFNKNVGKRIAGKVPCIPNPDQNQIGGAGMQNNVIAGPIAESSKGKKYTLSKVKSMCDNPSALGSEEPTTKPCRDAQTSARDAAAGNWGPACAAKGCTTEKCNVWWWAKNHPPKCDINDDITLGQGPRDKVPVTCYNHTAKEWNERRAAAAARRANTPTKSTAGPGPNDAFDTDLAGLGIKVAATTVLHILGAG